MTDWKHEIVPCGAYQEWRCQHPEYGILVGWHRAEPPTYHWKIQHQRYDRIYSIDTRRRGQSESLQAAMDATLAVLATMPRYANPLTNS
jgi:hypothetical protein